MIILLNYSVKLGKYDGNDDVFEYEIESFDETAENAYRRAVMTGTYFEDVPEFKPLCEQAYREIEKEQIKKLREEGDDAFALKCFAESKSPFDHGYSINVFFPDDELPIPDEKELEDYLKDALPPAISSLPRRSFSSIIADIPEI